MIKRKSKNSASAIGIIGGLSDDTLEFLKTREIRFKLKAKKEVKVLKIYRGLFKSTKYYFDANTGEQIKKE